MAAGNVLKQPLGSRKLDDPRAATGAPNGQDRVAVLPDADALPRRRWCSGRRAVDLEREPCIDRNRHQGKPMNKNVAAILFAAAMLAAQSAWAEDATADVTDMQALRTAVRADKKAFVASTIKLTDAEAKKFWPLYDTYQRSLDMSNRRRVVVVESLISMDKPISDLYAKNLASELIATDEAEIKARRTLHNRVMRALPAKKAARYLQLESKIRAVQAYDIAATIPLIK
jgi:hypothetical protein